MRRALPEALLAAVLTALLVTPIFGLRIQVDGVNVSLSHNPTPVIIAVIFIFLLRLFHQPLARVWAAFHVPASWRENPLTTFLGRMQQQPRYQTGLWALVLIAAVVWPFTASRGAVDVMTLALIYVMLGLGLNIVVGFAGLLVLGYAAFYAVGAYTYALLALHYELSFWLCLPISAALAALTGFLLGLPVLRLRGDYLAIVTLGFGEITRLLLNNLNFLTGGPDGIGNIPRPTLFGLEFNRVARDGGTTFHEFFGLDFNGSYGVIFLYLLGLALVLLILFVINRLLRMPLGRAWEALREDEIACRSLGLSPTVIKLSALTLSAAFAGAGGAAHLPGMVASMSPLPVIGVPVKSSNSIDGWDSVLSILQMPGGVPVATVALNGAKNAGILAAQIIGSSDKKVLDKIISYKTGLKEAVIIASESLKK